MTDSQSARGLGRELELAERLAREGGAIALRHRAAGVTAEFKEQNEPVTAADREINAFLEAALGNEFPDDAILAEESPPDPRRFDRDRTWMLDPIDGTREFIAGTENWEIMIGLVDHNEPVLGVVYNACTDTLISATKGGGSFIERAGIRRQLVHEPSPDGPKSLLARRGAAPDAVAAIASKLGISEIDYLGGFGARTIHGIEAGVDVVLHLAGSPREWDTCAIQVAAEEAGATIRNCLGERFTYNKPNPVQPNGMVLANTRHISRVLDVVIPVYAEWSAG